MTEIVFPDWYDDLAEFECQAKGCILNCEILVDGRRYFFNFYDLARFTQETRDEIAERGYFRDDFAVIVPETTKDAIRAFLLNLDLHNQKELFFLGLRTLFRTGYDPDQIADFAYRFYEDAPQRMDVDLDHVVSVLMAMDAGPQFHMTEEEIRQLILSRLSYRL